MERSDAELVERVLEGNEQAAHDLVARYQRPVFNLIARMVADTGTAEELAQDAFVKAFAHLASYDPSFKFSSWMFRIAHNTAIDHLRRPRLAVTSLDDERGAADRRAATAAGPSPLVVAERRELKGLLDAAIDRLRPEYREVVVLRYQDELSYEEIAAIVDRPLGTVKSDLHRARAELAALVREAGWAR